MEKILVEEYTAQFFYDNYGDQYKVVNFFGKLKFYKRGSKKINPTTWIATETEICPETWMLEKFEAVYEEV